MEQNLDEKQVHALEQELHLELLPGTEIMRDVGVKHFVHSQNSSHRVLVPQPTDNPHDPLNWSPIWKASAMIAASFVTFTQGYGPLALAPMFGEYIQLFDCTFSQAVQFTGVAILVLGFSNFFWVPISTTFGRRPVLIVSQLINIGAAIWRAKATSYTSFLGACALNGFAAGPAETLQPAIIADLFFLHDRGTWNTLYFVVYFSSLVIGPIISGPMSFAVGVAAFWWLFVAMCTLSTLMIVFMYPETKFHRPHLTLDATHATLKSRSVAPTETKDGPVETGKEVTQLSSHGTTEASRDPWLGRGTPSKAQWKFYSPTPSPLRDLLVAFWTPWKLFAFPIAEWASFVVSTSASTFLATNLTQDQAFAAPPYMFSPTSIGFTNFATLMGMFIGLATAGPLSDWVSMRATVKNNGIREPEMRLPSMIPYVLIMILGNVIVSVGYQNQWPWEAIVIIGYTAAGIQVAALPSIVSTYAVDSYKPIASSLFVSITVNKNVWGYGVSKFITPWIMESGYLPPIMLNMALCTLYCSLGILFYYKGKTFRRWTKNSSVHMM